MKKTLLLSTALMSFTINVNANSADVALENVGIPATRDNQNALKAIKSQFNTGNKQAAAILRKQLDDVTAQVKRLKAELVSRPEIVDLLATLGLAIDVDATPYDAIEHANAALKYGQKDGNVEKSVKGTATYLTAIKLEIDPLTAKAAASAVEHENDLSAAVPIFEYALREAATNIREGRARSAAADAVPLDEADRTTALRRLDAAAAAARAAAAVSAGPDARAAAARTADDVARTKAAAAERAAAEDRTRFEARSRPHLAAAAAAARAAGFAAGAVNADVAVEARRAAAVAAERQAFPAVYLNAIGKLADGDDGTAVDFANRAARVVLPAGTNMARQLPQRVFVDYAFDDDAFRNARNGETTRNLVLRTVRENADLNATQFGAVLNAMGADANPLVKATMLDLYGLVKAGLIRIDGNTIVYLDNDNYFGALRMANANREQAKNEFLRLWGAQLHRAILGLPAVEVAQLDDSMITKVLALADAPDAPDT